jgi:hypothetical protein
MNILNSTMEIDKGISKGHQSVAQFKCSNQIWQQHTDVLYSMGYHI